MKQVAAALQYAHERKFIHRDVKPENMLVGRHEEVLLSDFGLAALAHSTGSLSAQEAVGTLPYMSPEQIEGHPRAASDQYALAVVVYEWLCGARPFEGSVSEVMVQHLSLPPPPLRERVSTISPKVEQVVLRALAKEPRERFGSVQEFAEALERASLPVLSPTARLSSEQSVPGSPSVVDFATIAVSANEPITPTEATTPAEQPPGDLTTPQSRVEGETPLPGQVVVPTAAVVPSPLEPTMPVQQRARRLPRTTTALLIGLVVVIIAGGVLGSLSLLTHFGLLGARSVPPAVTAVRGGTWTQDINIDPHSLFPNQGDGAAIDEALYLPLFDGDAQGVIYPAAASEIPTVQNGGISADGKTWTFHLRPHLVWSDGQPYDARDVDFTWKLWLKFGAANVGNNNLDPTLISGADVSADDLSITFHLTRAFAPFLSLWVGGYYAPLPAHQFSAMSVEAIVKSPDHLNPRVVSGPFLMSESVPSDHYTVVRNPSYYRAKEGLPYLDKIIFRPVDENVVFKDLQAGTIDDAADLDVTMAPAYQDLSHYLLVTPPADAGTEGIYFNFHNTVLASHLEVRQAMAMAIDHQALITMARRGFANPLCTDHPSAYHPGYDPHAPCPDFNPAAANKLLNDSGWVKGLDGVRSKDGQRLEFEYSTQLTNAPWRFATEAIVQRILMAIGIKLDIQNYPAGQLFGSFLPGGKASPPTGAVAGRYDIAELAQTFWYDPDDSSSLSCDQIPPNGANIDFYCNHALDALYKQELATVDPGARQQIFRQIHEIYLMQFPFIILYSLPHLYIVRKGTHNYLPSDHIANINIWEWWCDGGKC